MQKNIQTDRQTHKQTSAAKNRTHQPPSAWVISCALYASSFWQVLQYLFIYWSSTGVTKYSVSTALTFKMNQHVKFLPEVYRSCSSKVRLLSEHRSKRTHIHTHTQQTDS